MSLNQSRSTLDADTQTFPFLGPEALAGFGLLGVPIYIYSFDTERVCWSNSMAREFWNAASAEELHDRILTPYSDATLTRLGGYRAAFHQGEFRNESWTFYPKGEAVTAMARCTGVRIEGHEEAMLVEINALASDSAPLAELRSIEALRHTPLMISLFADDGAVLMRNPAAQRCFQGLDDTLPAGADHFIAMFAEAQDGANARSCAEAAGHSHRSATMALPDEPIHALHVSSVSDPASGEKGLLVSQHDVSQLEALWRQLAASEDALDSVLSIITTPILVITAKADHVLKANHEFESLLGRSVAAGEPAAALFRDSIAFARVTAAAMRQQSNDTALQLKSPGGAAPWMQVSSALIAYDRQPAIALFFVNVDKMFRLNASLEYQRDGARETVSRQRRMLAIASHDARTPLSVIDGIAQLMEHRGGVMSQDEIVTRAARIHSLVQRTVELLDNTLERVQESSPILICRPTLGQLADCLRSVIYTFDENDTHHVFNMQIPVLPELYFDQALIEQAITSLVDNAIKYSPGRAEIDIVAQADSEVVAITIRDHGIGIPPGEWTRVFSENERGSNVGTVSGTGLGLSIVQQIINMHGGVVEVVPTEGPGTSIRIALPRDLGGITFAP